MLVIVVVVVVVVVVVAVAAAAVIAAAVAAAIKMVNKQQRSNVKTIQPLLVPPTSLSLMIQPYQQQVTRIHRHNHRPMSSWLPRFCAMWILESFFLICGNFMYAGVVVVVDDCLTSVYMIYLLLSLFVFYYPVLLLP